MSQNLIFIAINLVHRLKVIQVVLSSSTSLHPQLLPYPLLNMQPPAGSTGRFSTVSTEENDEKLTLQPYSHILNCINMAPNYSTWLRQPTAIYTDYFKVSYSFKITSLKQQMKIRLLCWKVTIIVWKQMIKVKLYFYYQNKTFKMFFLSVAFLFSLLL